MPSAAQNVPTLVRMIPTAYFSVFSGTCASGLRMITPAIATTSIASKPPATATPMPPLVPPTAMTMNTTSRPSRNTPFRARVKPIQSVFSWSARRDSTVCAYARFSSCMAITPAERSTALCSQRSPNRTISVPMMSFSVSSGTRVTMSWPNIATSRASRPSAESVPRSGARQPRVRPTASTIVSASTDSTAEPRNAAPNVSS